MKYLICNNHWKLNKDYNVDKILYLLVDRPNRINNYNSYFWENGESLFHRDYNLPAIVWSDGEIIWFKNGTFLLRK